MINKSQQISKAISELSVPDDFDEWSHADQAQLLTKANKLVRDEEAERDRLVAKKPDAAKGLDERIRKVTIFRDEVERRAAL